jgi:diaminopimelate epimerase
LAENYPRHNPVEKPVKIYMRGGELTVKIGADGEIYLTGGAEVVFRGVIDA